MFLDYVLAIHYCEGTKLFETRVFQLVKQFSCLNLRSISMNTIFLQIITLAQYLEESIFILSTIIIIVIKLIIISIQINSHLLRLLLCNLILLFGFLCLSFDFTLLFLKLFILDYITYFDNISDCIVIKCIFRFR